MKMVLGSWVQWDNIYLYIDNVQKEKGDDAENMGESRMKGVLYRPTINKNYN